jgi:general secretion pathway protein G
VVISIIGLLSSVILGAVSEGRRKAEITKAKEDFQSLVNAIEMYRQDNGSYPDSINGNEMTNYTSINNLTNILSPYIKTIPTLPSALEVAKGPYYYINQEGFVDPFYAGKIHCESAGGNEEYLIFFSSNSTYALEFPRVVDSSGGQMLDWSDMYNTVPFYCAGIPPR